MLYLKDSMVVSLERIRNSASNVSSSYGAWLFIATVFCIPLKLSLTYILLIPSLLIWLASGDAANALKQTAQMPFVRPLILFLIFALATSLFGLRPLMSMSQLGGMLFFTLSIPFFFTAIGKIPPIKALLALLLGQSIASYHSLLQSAFPESIDRLFVGAVSESGQLTLVIPLTLAIAVTIFREVRFTDSEYPALMPSVQDFLHCTTNTLLFGAFGFSHYFEAPWLLQLILAVAAGAMILNALLVLGKQLWTKECNSYRIYDVTLRVLLPALLIALLVNLKRGPWLGISLGVGLFLLLYYRKILLPLVITLTIAALSITPIQERLAHSSQHFFISGGRSTIWSIGLDLSIQYPLGVGFENSSFLREFAPEIPAELIHFHNNFLNILVETGWVGLVLFLWWLFATLRFCFSRNVHAKHEPVLRGIGCALIAWQAAGLVEYNFGDSEVFLVVLLILSMLAAYSENGFSQFEERQLA